MPSRISMALPPAEAARRVRLLLVVVMIDLSAVALVVPLLPLRMRELGVRPELVGLIGSVYSASQVVGGLVLGTLSDRVTRTSILMLNFAAAATSYAMVGLAETVWLLLVSRVVVGLCKQTMTLATCIVTDLTEPAERPVALGQLRTATTFAWTVGQFVGGWLAEYHQSLPAAVAVAQYALAALITLGYLDMPERKPPDPTPTAEAEAGGGRSIYRTAQKLATAPGIGPCPHFFSAATCYV